MSVYSFRSCVCRLERTTPEHGFLGKAEPPWNVGEILGSNFATSSETPTEAPLKHINLPQNAENTPVTPSRKKGEQTGDMTVTSQETPRNNFATTNSKIPTEHHVRDEDCLSLPRMAILRNGQLRFVEWGHLSGSPRGFFSMELQRIPSM